MLVRRKNVYLNTFIPYTASSVLCDMEYSYLTNSIPNTMEQIPSWEANRSSASQEKGPPPVHILSLINLVHISPSHFLDIHFNIILPFMPRSSK
jgi:hypothetical protein